MIDSQQLAEDIVRGVHWHRPPLAYHATEGSQQHRKDTRRCWSLVTGGRTCHSVYSATHTAPTIHLASRFFSVRSQTIYDATPVHSNLMQYCKARNSIHVYNCQSATKCSCCRHWRSQRGAEGVRGLGPSDREKDIKFVITGFVF